MEIQSESNSIGEQSHQDHHGNFSKMLAYAWDLLKKNPSLYIGLTLITIILNCIPYVSLFSIFLNIGFFNCCYKLMKNENINFNDYFFSFQSFSRFLNILVAIVLMTVATLLGYVLLIIPGIYISVALVFTIIAMVTENKDGIDALKRSKEIVNGRWWNVFMFCGFLFLLNIVGLLCLVVGLIVTIPLTVILLLEYYLYLTKN
ncbi:MAG: hypothetical protein PHY93_05705 [Bacteriovorax sp.]|nr:hypothetical protein [Bacteriovorax sp.]